MLGSVVLNGVVVLSSGFSGGWTGSGNAPLSLAVSVIAGTNTLQLLNVYNTASSPNPAGLLFSVANVVTGVTYAVSASAAGPTQSATTVCGNRSSASATLPGTYTATDGSCAVVACPAAPPVGRVYAAAGVCAAFAPAPPPSPQPPSPPQPQPQPPSPPPPLGSTAAAFTYTSEALSNGPNNQDGGASYNRFPSPPSCVVPCHLPIPLLLVIC